MPPAVRGQSRAVAILAAAADLDQTIGRAWEALVACRIVAAGDPLARLALDERQIVGVPDEARAVPAIAGQAVAAALQAATALRRAPVPFALPFQPRWTVETITLIALGEEVPHGAATFTGIAADPFVPAITVRVAGDASTFACVRVRHHVVLVDGCIPRTTGSVAIRGSRVVVRVAIARGSAMSLPGRRRP